MIKKLSDFVTLIKDNLWLVSPAAKTKSDGPTKRKTVQLQTVKVWQWDDNKAPQYDDSYQVAKSVVLVKVSNNSHIFLLQNIMCQRDFLWPFT